MQNLNELMPFMIFVLIFVVIIGIGIYVSKVMMQKRRELAESLQFSFYTSKEAEYEQLVLEVQKYSPNVRLSGWIAKGMYNRFPILFFDQIIGAGKSQKTYLTYICCFTKKIPTPFVISSDNALYRMFSIFMPYQDLQLGDEAFDAKYFVRGADAHAILEYLKKTGVEEAVDGWLAAGKGNSVSNVSLQMQANGFLPNVDTVRGILENMSKYAQQIQDAASPEAVF